MRQLPVGTYFAKAIAWAIAWAIDYLEINDGSVVTDLDIQHGSLVGIFGSKHDVRTVVVPAGVIVIRREIFRECVRLTSLTLPDTLLGIDFGVFRGCTGLTSVTLPAALVRVEVSV